ncbi:lignin-forming anionic peroxidase-like [Senna tora]|uniref:Peroxidase n=1 Tax=Senna tora TaxID=362788 RepID=A0A834SW96_9FABA|nr:lignin-forming anionic peroxidase-like [Senna tora]
MSMGVQVWLMLVVLVLGTTCEAQLSSTFYDNTCPTALSTIRTIIRKAVSKERRMAASLIRLHFHDCFVHGCDASILLDNSSDFKSEKTAGPNVNSVRGFNVIDQAKTEVEKKCPGVVSCADILAIAARDASFSVGGPSWTVKLGRRDSVSAYKDIANSDLPSFRDNLQVLISRFDTKGLSPRDMVALSGSHTLGQAQCFTFRDRIYNNNSNNIDVGFATKRQGTCPLASSPSNDEKLAPLDLVTPNSFDNNYFKNLIQKKGLLPSDQVLYNGGSTDNVVLEYSKNPTTFKSDFASAMIKMGDIEPLLGSAGIVRKICSAIN